MSSREQSQRMTTEIKDKNKNNPIGSTHKSGASLKPFSRKTQREKSRRKDKRVHDPGIRKQKIYNKADQCDLCKQSKPGVPGYASTTDDLVN